MSLKLKCVLAPPDLRQLIGSCLFASALACLQKLCHVACSQWYQLMALIQGR